MIAGYSTGAVPVNDGTVSPYGTSTQAQTVSGAPVSSGSDGSTIAGGALVFGYSASISGLAPNVTYTVAFPSLSAQGYLAASQSFSTSSTCSYPQESAGSFRTT